MVWRLAAAVVAMVLAGCNTTTADRPASVAERMAELDLTIRHICGARKDAPGYNACEASVLDTELGNIQRRRELDQQKRATADAVREAVRATTATQRREPIRCQSQVFVGSVLTNCE